MCDYDLNIDIDKESKESLLELEQIYMDLFEGLSRGMYVHLRGT